MKSSGNTCVVGMHWGDEAKGKIVDILADEHDFVVRFNGGNNAGHTVSYDGKTFKHHLVPCGAHRSGTTGVIGPGVVIDPASLLGEIEELESQDIRIAGRLLVSDVAHVVMPWHKQMEAILEDALGDGRIGTTLRGIGPCYAEKMMRGNAIRVGDLLDAEKLRKKIEAAAKIRNLVFTKAFDAEPVDADAVHEAYAGAGARLSDFVCDTTEALQKAMGAGRRILFEGAQGTLLDVDHGTYPYVTSSNASACGVWPGSGISARTIGCIIGVFKAYTTRVGAGPFPTEQSNADGERIRERGNEYGTTTGRPRRCGWLDVVALRYSVRLNGVDALAMTLLDVLSGFEEVKVCIGYRRGAKELPGFSREDEVLGEVEPVFASLKGWQEEITDVSAWQDLPEAARNYVEHVESLVGAPIQIISVGPGREQTIFRSL